MTALSYRQIFLFPLQENLIDAIHIRTIGESNFGGVHITATAGKVDAGQFAGHVQILPESAAFFCFKEDEKVGRQSGYLGFGR